jgi:hypothetical protein
MRARWIVNVTAYTVAGTLASALVGAGLGFVGAALLPERAGVPGLLAAVVVGLLALARTLGVTAIPFPQPARQTRDIWVKASSPAIASVRWGLDIGLIYTTRFTFPGTWFLTVVAVVVSEPGFGAALFVAYWIGRAMSVWLGPLLMRDARETPLLLTAVHEQYAVFSRTHAVALALGTAAVLVFLAEHP